MDEFDRIGEEEGNAGEAPWEGEAPAGGDGRRDGFGALRKHKFLRIFQTTGCIADGCRRAGISRQTFYNHLESDPEFAKHVRIADRMAGTTVEIMAWERGVEGIEEPVIRGGKVVGTRLKRSDSILRLLLQGSNPEKYGPRPGFTRARLLRYERERIEQEVRARIAAEMPTFDESIAMLEPRLKAFGQRRDAERLAQGWTKAEDGYMIPPGWVKAEGAGAPAPAGDGEGGEPWPEGWAEPACDLDMEGLGTVASDSPLAPEDGEGDLGPIEIKSMPMGTVYADGDRPYNRPLSRKKRVSVSNLSMSSGIGQRRAAFPPPRPSLDRPLEEPDHG